MGSTMIWLFFITLISESIVLIAFNRNKHSLLKILLFVVAVNFFTWGGLAYMVWEYNLDINLGELMVLVAETLCLHLLLRIKLHVAFLQAFIANGISYGLGLLYLTLK